MMQSRQRRRQADGGLFAAATVLARKGRYTEATALLRRAEQSKGCSAAQALDLRARMLAQQGRYVEAQECWRTAVNLDRSKPAYSDALDRLRRTARSPYLNPAAVAFVVLLVAILWQAAFVLPDLRDRQQSAEASLAALRTEMKASQGAFEARESQATANVATIGAGLREMEGRVATQLQSLSTSALTADQRDAIMAGIEAIRTNAKIEMGAVMSALSELRKRVEAVGADAREGNKILPTAEQVADLHRSVSKLENQLAQLSTQVAELKEASKANPM